VGGGGGDGEGADGGDGLLVEDRLEVEAAVGGLPDSPRGGCGVVDERVARHARDATDAPARGGADGAIFQVLDFRQSARFLGRLQDPEGPEQQQTQQEPAGAAEGGKGGAAGHPGSSHRGTCPFECVLEHGEMTEKLRDASDSAGLSCPARRGATRWMRKCALDQERLRVAYGSRTGELVFASGGHPAPLLRRPDGTVEEVPTPPGLMLGLIPGALHLTELRLRLLPGETFILYTDGYQPNRKSTRLNSSH